MIDFRSARDLADKFIRSRYEESVPDVLIRDDLTKERSFGWVFYFASKRRSDLGKPTYELTGAGPILVDRRSSAVFQLPSARPSEEYIADYEARHPDP